MRLSLLLDFNQYNLKSQQIIQDKNTLYCIFLTSMFAILLLFFILGSSFFKLVLPAILISLIYPFSIKINKKFYSIRQIPFFKIFLIAFTWSYITVLVPLWYHDFKMDYFMLDIFFQRLLFVIAISIPFDIRDCDTDKIMTIPNAIGIIESKFFAWFCLLIIDILLIIDVINHHITLPSFIALFISIEICALLIYYSNKNRHFLFYGLFVESLSIIMCLFVFIASFF
tara:strand:- start:175 stop:855 length:681 start_codon:yes stop_codon:yes gene_type:complete